MLSVQPQPFPERAHIPLHVEGHNPPKDIELNEVTSLSSAEGRTLTSPRQLGSLQDAIEPFAK